MHFSTYLQSAFQSASAMIPEPFKALWNDATFASLVRALPIVLTSGLFMVFWFLDVTLAGLKWTLFIVILGTAFVWGLLLLVMAVILVVALVGLVVDGAFAKEEALLEAEIRVETSTSIGTTSGLAQEEEEMKFSQKAKENAAVEQARKHPVTEATAKTDAECSDNICESYSSQSSNHGTKAGSSPSRSPTRLSARARRAWMNGEDLPLVAERERSPYGAGLSTDVRGGDGSEEVEGSNSGDEDMKVGHRDGEEGSAGAGSAGGSGMSGIKRGH